MLVVGNEKMCSGGTAIARQYWHGRQLGRLTNATFDNEESWQMRIMFEDLTYEAQVRLMDEVGISSPAEMGWYTVPIAVVNFLRKLPVGEEDDFVGGLYEHEDDR